MKRSFGELSDDELFLDCETKATSPGTGAEVIDLNNEDDVDGESPGAVQTELMEISSNDDRSAGDREAGERREDDSEE